MSASKFITAKVKAQEAKKLNNSLDDIDAFVDRIDRPCSAKKVKQYLAAELLG